MMPGEASADDPKRCKKMRGFPRQVGAFLVRASLTDHETLHSCGASFCDTVVAKKVTQQSILGSKS